MLVVDEVNGLVLAAMQHRVAFNFDTSEQQFGSGLICRHQTAPAHPFQFAYGLIDAAIIEPGLAILVKVDRANCLAQSGNQQHFAETGALGFHHAAQYTGVFRSAYHPSRRTGHKHAYPRLA